eukprot:CAMPEP_0117647794 /NCGR_PEP_ID=MMETSP0804-20121206/38_1 /TAXON_ID=1074897 /ORGANISM="Tetraselmis astigmatica, Strain CCMP880" /LENGTH=156 /DNA_ID=CAMNT_0005453307 /DNA_START=80 /DNA_END=551 /DNA_ORIENTATION=+
MSAFLKHLGTLKPAQAGTYVWETVSSPATWSNLRNQGTTKLMQYKVDHIDTGSAKPLKDVMVGVFCIAYVMAWPTEYAHWKHERDARLTAATECSAAFRTSRLTLGTTLACLSCCGSLQRGTGSSSQTLGAFLHSAAPTLQLQMGDIAHLRQQTAG